MNVNMALEPNIFLKFRVINELNVLYSRDLKKIQNDF